MQVVRPASRRHQRLGAEVVLVYDFWQVKPMSACMFPLIVCAIDMMAYAYAEFRYLPAAVVLNFFVDRHHRQGNRVGTRQTSNIPAPSVCQARSDHPNCVLTPCDQPTVIDAWLPRPYLLQTSLVTKIPSRRGYCQVC
jgi:hypothetical protein